MVSTPSFSRRSTLLSSSGRDALSTHRRVVPDAHALFDVLCTHISVAHEHSLVFRQSQVQGLEFLVLPEDISRRRDRRQKDSCVIRLELFRAGLR